MSAESITVDSKVEALISHPQDETTEGFDQENTKEAEDDPDALFASLEAEEDNSILTARAQQLSAEMDTRRSLATGSGPQITYRTLHSDDDVLRFTTSTEKCVVHFSHADFARCATMDVHLLRLVEARTRFHRDAAEAGEDAVFARVDVKDCPFLVEKLGVRVLPCVIGFVEGAGVGRVVGFEGLGVWKDVGGSEDGMDVTARLEKRLVEMEVCRKEVLKLTQGMENDSDEDEEEKERLRDRLSSGRRGIQGSKIRKGNEEDDDEEWD